MSQRLINRSPDLKRLQEEGYDIEIRQNHLLVKGVPYVSANKEIKLGTLVSTLNLAGDVTAPPDTHVAMFTGEYPCDKNGAALNKIFLGNARTDLGGGLWVDHSFSSKPTNNYPNYYEKMATYVAILSDQAKAIDPEVTATTFPTAVDEGSESVFNYADTATTRAGIGRVTQKLQGWKIAIVGVGGTGSYVLDLVAKTPVSEIHIFDGDKFSQHNAFRSPGAPSLDELSLGLQKVGYFQEHYSRMHKHIIPHDCYVDASNVDLLQEMDFVFICIDRSAPKKFIIGKLKELDVPFVDVGMGVYLAGDSLGGITRVTTCTKDKKDHLENHISFADIEGDDAYAQNIQIADLNSLNASLAVIKWKKTCGFYVDFDCEYHSTYTIDGNFIKNEDML